MDLSEYCEVEYRDESGVVISNKTRIVELPDGSIHRVPIVNKAAMEVLSERRKIASTRKNMPSSSTSIVPIAAKAIVSHRKSENHSN